MQHRTLVAITLIAAIATPAVGGLAYMYLGWLAGVAATLVIVGAAFAATTILLRDFADALQAALYGRPDEEAD